MYLLTCYYVVMSLEIQQPLGFHINLGSVNCKTDGKHLITSAITDQSVSRYQSFNCITLVLSVVCFIKLSGLYFQLTFKITKWSLSTLSLYFWNLSLMYQGLWRHQTNVNLTSEYYFNNTWHGINILNNRTMSLKIVNNLETLYTLVSICYEKLVIPLLSELKSSRTFS